MALKEEDSKPGQASAAAAAAAVAAPTGAAVAAGAAATHSAGAAGAASAPEAGHSGPAVANSSHHTAPQPPQRQPSQAQQQAGEEQQAERRHKRKAAEPRRAVSPCIVGFAAQEARQHAAQHQDGQPAQPAAQQQEAQLLQHAATWCTRVPAPQLPQQRQQQPLPLLPPTHQRQPWQVAQLHQQPLYYAQQLYHAQGWRLPYVPVQQLAAPASQIEDGDGVWELVSEWTDADLPTQAAHSNQVQHAEQQGSLAGLHTRPAAATPRRVQPPPAVMPPPPPPQPEAPPQRARVPAMQALIMERYARLRQQRQEEEQLAGKETERSLHAQPTTAPLSRPAAPQRTGAVPAEGAAGGSSNSPGAAWGARSEQQQKRQRAAASLDGLEEQGSSKLQRSAPAGPHGQQHQRPSQQRQAQPSQQQPSGSHRPAPLLEAVQVSTGKWDALTAVSAALAELERSAPNSAAKQAQLDGALFAALRRNRCPPACIAVVKMLLEAGASATALDSSRPPPQQQPAAGGGSATGGSSGSDGGRPPLQAFLLSCESWRWSEEEAACLVQTLLAAGASATERDGQGLSPCERAVRVWSGAAVRGALKTLAAAGADLLEVDGRGRTLLHHAAAFSVGSQGLEAAVQLLLEAGCDPLAVDKPDGKAAGGKLALQLLDSKPGRSTGAAARLLAEGMRVRSAADREAAAALRVQLDAQHCCVVCMLRPRTVALLPCGHFGFCPDCVAASTACPLCRQRVSARHTIHPA